MNTHIICLYCSLVLLSLTIALLCNKKKEDFDNSLLFPIPNDYMREAKEICSSYNKGMIPSKQEDCPDTSFTLVAPSLTNVYIGKAHPSCMQLQTMSYPNCYSNEKGEYEPWFGRINAKSP